MKVDVQPQSRGRGQTLARNVDATAAEIVRAFNTWAYKREQPSDLDLLHESVAHQVRSGCPVSFVLYWGKGQRHAVAEPERRCLAYLSAMSTRIGAVYRPGAVFTLLLTDTHAVLNNHGLDQINSYFDGMATAAAGCGFAVRRLSSVVDASPVHADYDALDIVPDEMLEQLTECAAKWYGGPDGAAAGARQYLAMNMRERRAVELEYPRSIFVTFNGSDFRAMFPDRLPVFYMYSLRKGTAIKPWFMPADTQPIPAAHRAQSVAIHCADALSAFE